VVIERIRVGDRTFMEDGRLVRTARFGLSDNEPRRSPHPAPDVYQQQRRLPYDSIETLRTLVGKKIAVIGRLGEEDGRRVLRHREGAGIVIEPVRDESLEALLAAFTGDTAKLELDLVLESIYPWNDRRDPARSRKLTRLVGEARVRSASAQNFHVVGRR
jgi:hypothetical protein